MRLGEVIRPLLGVCFASRLDVTLVTELSREIRRDVDQVVPRAEIDAQRYVVQALRRRQVCDHVVLLSYRSVQVEHAFGAVSFGEVVQFEYRIIQLADGAIRRLHDTSYPILDENRTVSQIGDVTEDLTLEEVRQVYAVSAAAVEPVVLPALSELLAIGASLRQRLHLSWRRGGAVVRLRARRCPDGVVRKPIGPLRTQSPLHHATHDRDLCAGRGHGRLRRRDEGGRHRLCGREEAATLGQESRSPWSSTVHLEPRS